MQGLWGILPLAIGASIGCSAPATAPAVIANEPLGTLAPSISNDCPGLLGPWSNEVFTACAPLPYPLLPLCSGAAVCGRPCSLHSVGYAGRDQWDDTITFTYDETGQHLTQELRANHTPRRACHYDNGRLESCTDFHGDQGGGGKYSVTRDANGAIVAMVTLAAEPVPVERDASHRITKVGRRTVTYDEHGWITSEDGNLVEHDSMARVTKIGTGDEARVFTYEADRLIAIVGPDSTNQHFHYDGAGRLDRIMTGGLEMSNTTAYDYDCN